MRKIILFSIIAMMMIGITVVALQSFESSGTFPSEFTTITSTAVNFSVNFNNTANSERVFEMKIMNSSDPSSSRAYGALATVAIRNSSTNNFSQTMKNNERVWWFYNITNITGGPVTSDVRIFDVDTKFLTFAFGGYDTFNITLNLGDLNMTGYVVSAGIRLKNTTRSSAITEPCDASHEGLLRYSGANNTGFWGCTASGWKALSNSSG